VSVDPWKKGKNDSLEGILRNQGYSLKDIYTKDAQGKTMIDQVAAQNGLKNPNLIQPGQKLQVPHKEGSESLSTRDLKNGEQQSAQVANQDAGLKADIGVSKDADGNSTSQTKITNDQNHSLNTSSTTTVSAGGRIDSSAAPTKGGVKTSEVAMNSDGSAVTDHTIEATPDKTVETFRDADKTANLGVKADNNSVTVTNPGGKNGDVATTVDISEKSTDGFFENLFAGRYCCYNNDSGEKVDVSGASNVTVTKNQDGSVSVLGTVNGKEVELKRTAGNRDDGALERFGAGIDHGIKAVTDTVSDAASSVWSWVSGG
jgi:hypothetical protein